MAGVLLDRAEELAIEIGVYWEDMKKEEIWRSAWLISGAILFASGNEWLGAMFIAYAIVTNIFDPIFNPWFYQ